MAETIEVPVKGVEMEVEKGQGFVALTLGPMVEKRLRVLTAAAARGKLKVVIDG